MNPELHAKLQQLVALAVCPEDHSGLRIAPQALLEKLNAGIAQGGVRENGGTLLTSSLDGILVRADNTRGYPVRDGIAVLLVDAAIALDDADQQMLSNGSQEG